MQDITIKSVYIHIPFCKKICSYCDFCKNYYNDSLAEKYLDALKKEIDNNYKNVLIDTIYIGGGTPSCLSKNNLYKLFNILKVFKLSNNYEFTFECNYEDINDDLLSLLKLNNVNRISIGLQTFNKKFENLLERTIDKDNMLESINLTKKYFNNINVDLMYGFNNETIEELEEDINMFLSLDIPHISTYALIIEDHTKLGINNTKELDDDLENSMYYKIIHNLKENNYNHYEISNFSKDNYESKHNLTYWNNNEYYGFGAGTSGYVNGIRYDNTKSINNYIDGKTRIYEEKVDINQSIRDMIMLNLRKSNGINKNDFKIRYNKNIKDVFDLEQLINNKLLIENNDNIYIPEDKLFVSNEIIVKIYQSFKN